MSTLNVTNYVITKVDNVREEVEKLLSRRPDARDNDELLVSLIWYFQLKKSGVDMDHLTGLELLALYRDGKLTSADIITRARRKAQEEQPQLRGIHWQTRRELREGAKKLYE